VYLIVIIFDDFDHFLAKNIGDFLEIKSQSHDRESQRQRCKNLRRHEQIWKQQILLLLPTLKRSSLLQRLRCSCKFRSRRTVSRSVFVDRVVNPAWRVYRHKPSRNCYWPNCHQARLSNIWRTSANDLTRHLNVAETAKKWVRQRIVMNRRFVHSQKIHLHWPVTTDICDGCDRFAKNCATKRHDYQMKLS
jgi:hypothetical protein